jgi:hypothetical protein
MLLSILADDSLRCVVLTGEGKGFSAGGDLYEKWNPMNLASNWKTPTLVIHGELDYRVPFTQGIATFTALQRQGVKSRLVVYPGRLSLNSPLQFSCLLFPCFFPSCLPSCPLPNDLAIRSPPSNKKKKKKKKMKTIGS